MKARALDAAPRGARAATSGATSARARIRPAAEHSAVAGLAPVSYVQVIKEPISLDAILAAVASPACGGTAVFVGTVRDDDDTRSGGVLQYEAYDSMALRKMEEIAAGIRERCPEARLAIVHRIGPIPVGEASVVIAVATPHRPEAFAECRQAIETLKRDVPIWKVGGSRDCCPDRPPSERQRDLPARTSAESRRT